MHAYRAALDHQGQPTVILAKTIRAAGWAAVPSPQRHPPDEEVRAWRPPAPSGTASASTCPTRLEEYPPYHKPDEDSDLHKYLERRRDLGGPVPTRVDRSGPLDLPSKDLYAQLKKGSGKQEVATTMALVRLIRDLLRNEDVGRRIVPIIPDEARTFGMDSVLPQPQDLLVAGHELRRRRP